MRQAWQEASPESRLRAASRIRFFGDAKGKQKSEGSKKMFLRFPAKRPVPELCQLFFLVGGVGSLFLLAFPSESSAGDRWGTAQVFFHAFFVEPP